MAAVSIGNTFLTPSVAICQEGVVYVLSNSTIINKINSNKNEKKVFFMWTILILIKKT